jgi:HemY protein
MSSLEDAWRKVPEALRRDARVAGAAAEGYIALQAGGRAAELIERSLEQAWDSDLAGLYGDCAGSDALGQIERAERWLAAHADDAALLLTLGRLCAVQGLWGKAQNYIDASIAIEPTHAAHLAAAQLNDKLGNAEAAQRHTRVALELALVKLRERAAG